MSFRHIVPVLLLSLTFGVLISGCEGPPDEIIMDAEDAINSAIAAGAADASPGLLGKAQTLLQEAKMLREQGKNKDARKKAEVAIIRARKAEKYAMQVSGVAKKAPETSNTTEKPESEAPQPE